MNGLNERIQSVISARGIKKAAFAEALNVSQAFVSQLCSGASNPSDRTIADICREFDVNEEWLRTGAGSMFIEKTRDEDLAELFGKVLAGDPDFRRRLLSAMSRLSEEQWAVLEEVAQRLVADMEEQQKDPGQ